MNNDLISRSELKKTIKAQQVIDREINSNIATISYNNLNNIIDNAPPVEITEEQAIDKLHETGWLQEHDKQMTERPQGEWIRVDKYKVKCNKCEVIHYIAQYPSSAKINYCSNCGARMKGGDEK